MNNDLVAKYHSTIARISHCIACFLDRLPSKLDRMLHGPACYFGRIAANRFDRAFWRLEKLNAEPD